MEFGNVYTIMNNFPDAKTNPAFTTFMSAYGSEYRSDVVFTINYQNILYYISALGMRTTSPINFTYIDAIGFSGDFGVLDATIAYELSDSALKAAIIDSELSTAVAFTDHSYPLTYNSLGIFNTSFILASKTGRHLLAHFANHKISLCRLL